MKAPKYNPLAMASQTYANEYGRKCMAYDKYKAKADMKFLVNYVRKNDLGDEMFDLQDAAFRCSATEKGAERLYPKFMKELSVFFEENPKQKEIIIQNKKKVISGLVKFIKDVKTQ